MTILCDVKLILLIMKKNVFVMLVMSVALLFCSCSNGDHEEMEKSIQTTTFELIKNQQLFSIGNLVPNLVEVKGDVATIGFHKSARLFSITLTDDLSYQSVEYLKKAMRDKTPLEISILNSNSKEIGKISESPDCHINFVSGNITPLSSRGADGWAIDISQFDDLMAEARRTINWDYIGDGCYARAHAVRRMCERMGIACDKVFIYGSFSITSPKFDCDVYWRYHVAAAVYVQYGDQVLQMMIDPALCPYSYDVTYEEWKNTLGGYVEAEYTAYSGIYYMNKNGGQTMYDDLYLDTDTTLDMYKNAKGC